jgi:hypothetical protein
LPNADSSTWIEFNGKEDIKASMPIFVRILLRGTISTRECSEVGPPWGVPTPLILPFVGHSAPIERMKKAL